jgi:hypothetical protein
MGSQVCQLLATLCVTLSHTLFALSGADLAGGFCLRTLSYSRSTVIVGPILDMVDVSHFVMGTLCKELGRRVNMGLLHLVRAQPWGYKAGNCPCAHLHPLTQTPIASFPAPENREIKKERERYGSMGKFLRHREHCFSFHLKLWQSSSGPR